MKRLAQIVKETGRGRSTVYRVATELGVTKHWTPGIGGQHIEIDDEGAELIHQYFKFTKPKTTAPTVEPIVGKKRFTPGARAALMETYI